MLPPALKQPDSCDDFGYGLCTEVPLYRFNHPNSPYCTQGPLLKAFQLPGCRGPVSPAAILHNLLDEYGFLFSRMEHALLSPGAQSHSGAKMRQTGLILRHTLLSVMHSPYRVN